MVTQVKGSSFTVQGNFNYISLTDPQIGAVGDGVTDNTAAIAYALTLNLPIFIPPGIFLTQGIIVPAGASIFGTGVASKLKLKTGSNSIMLTCTGGIDFKSFYLDVNKPGQIGSNLHGIKLTDGIDVSLEDLRIINSLGDGINITGTNTAGVSLHKVFISGATRNGITIEAGTNINLSQVRTFNADNISSPGDGISLAPTNALSLVSEVTIIGCTARNNPGKGLSILGNGGRNVSDVNVIGGSYSYNGSHGIHAFTAQAVTINSANVKNNTGDGARLEGDVQYSRVSECVFNANMGTCVREVTTGATPNNNGLIYNAAFGNGSNTAVKVGAASFII